MTAEPGGGDAHGGLIPTGGTALYTIIGIGDPNVPHPVDSLDPNSLVGEVVTLPRVTPWIAAALERGCRVQYGADMSNAQLHLVGPWWGLDVPPAD